MMKLLCLCLIAQVYSQTRTCEKMLLDKRGEAITATQANSIGTIDIYDTMIIEMDIAIGLVDSSASEVWESVFHIGRTNTERWPGIWLHSTAGTEGTLDGFTLAYGDNENWNNYQAQTEAGGAFSDNTMISYKSIQTQSQLTIIQNGQTIYDQTYKGHPTTTSGDVNVYIGDPWYQAADVTITNLVISTVTECDDATEIIPFTCQTRQGSASTNPSLPSSVSCEEGETLVSCGIIGSHELQGTYISPDDSSTCIAGTSSASWSVTAVANCCQFPLGSINSLKVITSETQANNQVVAQCPLDSTLTGCQVNYQSGTTNNIRGSYPGPQQGTNTPPAQIGTTGIDTENQCIAEARSSATNIRGGAQCVETAAEYELDCVTTGKYTNMFGFTGDCPTDYQLIACNTYTPDHTLDSWYIVSGGTGCYIQQDSHINQYANGICCQLRKEPDPTPEPTPQPTTAQPTTAEPTFAGCEKILLDKRGESITAMQSQSIGTIDIYDNMIIEMDIAIGLVDSSASEVWESVFHIGRTNTERWPGIWLHSTAGTEGALDGFSLAYGDNDNWNNYQAQTEAGGAFSDNTIISYKSIQTQSQLTIIQNGEKIYDEAYKGHPTTTSGDVNVYIGDPWYQAADVTITNLVISTYGSCTTPSPTYADCLVGDIMYSHGQTGGYIGETCTGENTFDGTQSICNDGEMERQSYSGECSEGTSCCQSGEPGTFGAATCVSAEVCDEWVDTRTEIVPFECSTRQGSASSNPSSPSSVSCEEGETLVSCGVIGSHELQGTYIDPTDSNTCIAGTSSASWSVVAVANCCVFPTDAIDGVTTVTSETQANNQVVTECPSGSALTGCQVNYQSGTTNNIRGSYPGPQQGTNTSPAQTGTTGIDTKNQCIAEARTSATNVRGGAQCIDTASDYILDCVTTGKFTNMFGFTGDCPTDYQLIACNTYTTSHTLDSWYLVSGGAGCYIQQDSHVNQYANGICCQLRTEPDPTPEPTPQPTTAQPTTAQPTTSQPTTAQPTLAGCEKILLDKQGESITAIQSQSVGTIDIYDNMIIEMDIAIGLVDSSASEVWESVFHIGRTNTERWPGIWLHSTAGTEGSLDGFSLAYGDNENWNNYQAQTEAGGAFSDNTIISYKSIQTQSQLTIIQNGEKIYDEAYKGHPITTTGDVNVYIGDPWYQAADVTITNLVISTYGDCPTTTPQATEAESTIIPFTCQARRGTASNDPSTPSTVTCEEGETLVSCGVSGSHDLQGTYIDPVNPNTCVVGVSTTSWSVTAIANCCIFPTDAITSINTQTSEDQSGTQVLTTCPSESTLTGCQVNYQSGSINNIRGSYSGPQQGANTPPAQIGTEGIDTEDSCIAEARTEDTEIRGGAQCLETASNYVLDCVTTGAYTNRFGFTGDCPEDYQLISCNTYTPDYTLDAWYLTDDGGCYVQQDSHINQYANGICCQLRREPDPEPIQEIVEFTCQARRGTASNDPNSPSTISCEEGETLVSCGISGSHELQGTYIDPADSNTCIAGTSSTSWSVAAIANCCVFPTDAIDAVNTVTSTVQSGAQVVTECPAGSTLTGCQVNYESGTTNNIRGSYPGPQQGTNTAPMQIGTEGIDTEDQCVAEARTSATNIRGGAQCLEVASEYELDCVTTGKFTNRFGFTGDCPEDYQLVACNTYTPDYTLDAWYLTDDEGCYVQQDSHINQYANGICCQLLRNVYEDENDDSTTSSTTEPVDGDTITNINEPLYQYPDPVYYYGPNPAGGVVEEDFYIYLEVDAGVTFEEARTLCLERGTDLASITSRSELDIAYDIIDANYEISQQAWIGLYSETYLREKDGFAFLDGSECVLTLPRCVSWWVEGKPLNIASAEGSQCANLSPRLINNDIQCEEKLKGVLCNGISNI